MIENCWPKILEGLINFYGVSPRYTLAAVEHYNGSPDKDWCCICQKKFSAFDNTFKVTYLNTKGKPQQHLILICQEIDSCIFRAAVRTQA